MKSKCLNRVYVIKIKILKVFIDKMRLINIGSLKDIFKKIRLLLNIIFIYL